MQIIRSLGLIFNAKTLIITILALFSTYISYSYEFFAGFPFTLLGIAVVFPIVFSINSAYKRREVALEHYANIKAHGRSIFYAVRDWVPGTSTKFQNRYKRLLYDVLYHCRIMFNTDHSDDAFREKQIYSEFSAISKFIQECRKRDLPAGEISRCNQYLSKMLISFEGMKHIYQYRTPITLRAYSKTFILLLPIVYGPSFAKMALSFPSIYLLYLMPILFTVILVSLDNIQDQLENPFDLIGEDDIKMNVEKFVALLEVDEKKP
jgi:predicted membrane chloride channel (bestrophin family)